MPKIILTAEQREHDRLCHNLKMCERGRGVREMAKICHTSPTTYSRRRKRPEGFSLSELSALCREASVSVEDFVGKTIRLGGADR